MHWETLKSYIDKVLSFPRRSFSRERILDFENQTIQTDCIGVIHLLLQEMSRAPFPSTLRAFEVYDFLKGHHSTNKVYHLQEGMVLGWRKKDPPRSGDSGHFCIIYEAPLEVACARIARREYCVKVFEVTKANQGPRLHQLHLQTNLDGEMIAVCWNTQKWKETPLIAGHLFGQKRGLCPECERVYSLCLCSLLPIPKWEGPAFSILRHPTERNHPLNSVKILEKAFMGLKVWDREILEASQFSSEPLLLYPSEKAISIEELPLEQWQSAPILLLDGTWKKTKRLLFQNPWMNELTHIKIKKESGPLYKIRKELSHEHYSTLEVFAELWRQRSPHHHYKANRLEEIFTHMIDQQIERMGADRYKENYQHYPGFKS